MLSDEWLQLGYIHGETPEECSEALCTFFSVSDCFAFDDILINNGIPYDRVAFYDPEDLVF